MAIQIQSCTQTDMFEKAEELFAQGVIPARVGSTTRGPTARAAEYVADGYKGIMYVAKTDNIKKRENQLLEDHPGEYNVQLRSGVQEEKGWVYMIIGDRSVRKKKIIIKKSAH